MSQREVIASFLATQLDFIFFFYGLAFILLGVVCFGIARVHRPGNAWRMLGGFGFVHGAGEWLDLTALVVADSPAFALFRMALMAGSFILLLEFTRQKAIRFGLKPVGPVLYVGMAALILMAGWFGGPATAGALVRYLIGFFAASAASWVFIVHARRFSGAARGLALATAAGLALYALAAGAIPPPAPFWPANVYNQVSFLHFTGIPIQLVRGSLACLLAFSVWAIWGHLLISEVSSDRYTRHLRHQFIWTIAAMSAVLVLGWALTQFLGGVYQRNVEETANGDIDLLASRFRSETAIVDRIAGALAGSGGALHMVTNGASRQDDQRGRSALDLGLQISGAQFGALFDASGKAVAISGDIDDRKIAGWPAAAWFQRALGGQRADHFGFDPADQARHYYASYPVRSEAGSVVGVVVLQKSLDRVETELLSFSHPYFVVDSDGTVMLTNRPALRLHALWPSAATSRSAVGTAPDSRFAVGGDIKDASWIRFNDQRHFVRRIYLGSSQWSVVLAVSSAKLYASRVLGIIVTLLLAMMALIYFFGREHGIRDRIQLDRRLELQQMALDLRQRATTDLLTGLHNRWQFDQSLAEEISRSRRYGSPLALIIFDVDHFKRVNDAHGHPVGDDVLIGLAQVISKQVRNTDVLARWGGEEFVILMPGVDGATAYRAAEKLRALVAETGFAGVGTITCSFGVAEYSQADSAEALLARADTALYRAKSSGRNRTELAALPASSSKVASVA